MISKRRCSKCNELQPIVAFATYTHRNGRQGRRGVCRACRDEHAIENFNKLKEWRKKYNARTKTKRQQQSAVRRAAAKSFVDEYKATRPCVDCGRRFPPVALDLDHVRGAKTRCVASLVSGAYKLDLIKAEIQKCEVVCACCHRIRTAKRKENLSGSLKKTGRWRTARR